MRILSSRKMSLPLVSRSVFCAGRVAGADLPQFGDLGERYIGIPYDRYLAVNGDLPV